MADVAYGSLPFAEQIAFFRRKLNLRTNAWTDIWQSEHDHAFVVAGANRDDLVADFRAAIDKAIANGTTLEEFRKDFDAIVAKHGWSYNGGRNWRSRVIYETNLRTSYAAGRYAQLQAIKHRRPYWQYEHSDAVEHPRPLHLAWNGLVLDADDPWWQTHYPPNGWGCQCSVRSLAKRDLKRLGKDGPDQAPPTEMETVTVGARGPTPRMVETPAGIDPGFGYTPGRNAFEQLVQQRLEKTIALPAPAASTSATEALANARVADAVASGYEAFQADVLAAGQARNNAYVVGALKPELVRALAEIGVEPATAAITIRDADLLHALRATKAARTTSGGLPIGLTPEEFARLPALLENAQAVLLEVGNGRLLFVSAGGARGARKIVVAVNYTLKTTEGKQTANAVLTGQAVSIEDVLSNLKPGQVRLLIGSL